MTSVESQDAPKPPTLNQELAVIAFGVCFLAIVISIFGLTDPDRITRLRFTAGDFIAGVIAGTGHALWISASLRRHGRRVGAWKFFAFFLGPIAAILHLTLTYRFRAIFMIPLYFGVLGVVIGLVIILQYLLPQ